MEDLTIQGDLFGRDSLVDGGSKDSWGTPGWLVEASIIHFSLEGYELDLCATPDNRKARYCLTVKEDSLNTDWLRLPKHRQGLAWWLNPQYSVPERWMAKAVRAASQRRIVSLVKHDMSTEWWRLIENSGRLSEVCNIVGSRIGHECPVTGEETRGSSFSSVIVMLDPNPSGVTRRGVIEVGKAYQYVRINGCWHLMADLRRAFVERSQDWGSHDVAQLIASRS